MGISSADLAKSKPANAAIDLTPTVESYLSNIRAIKSGERVLSNDSTKAASSKPQNTDTPVEAQSGEDNNDTGSVATASNEPLDENVLYKTRYDFSWKFVRHVHDFFCCS